MQEGDAKVDNPNLVVIDLGPQVESVGGIQLDHLKIWILAAGEEDTILLWQSLS